MELIGGLPFLAKRVQLPALGKYIHTARLIVKNRPTVYIYPEQDYECGSAAD